MDYFDLEVWQKTAKLANKIFVITESFPVPKSARLVDQMCRAAISVPSNIAQGIGRQYRKETIQFLFIARGSLYELETQCYISNLNDYLSEAEYQNIQMEIKSCIRLLQGFINYVRTAKLR